MIGSFIARFSLGTVTILATSLATPAVGTVPVPASVSLSACYYVVRTYMQFFSATLLYCMVRYRTCGQQILKRGKEGKNEGEEKRRNIEGGGKIRTSPSRDFVHGCSHE